MYKHQSLKVIVGLGISVAFGLWTYVGFRSIGLALTLIALLIIVCNNESKNFKIKSSLLLLGTILFFSGPLLLFGLTQPYVFWARTKAISIFHQQLPMNELLLELGGATSRTLRMFGLMGDPNPRQNPAGVSVFDWGTTFGFLVAAVWGIRSKKKYLIAIIGGLLTVNLLNDIITLEQIPEMHYYGLGHPNTLRIALILPLIVSLASFGWYQVILRIPQKELRKGIFALIIMFISGFNANAYFNQPLTQYLYIVNGVPQMKIVTFLNQSTASVAISPSFAKDPRIQFLANKSYEEITTENVIESDNENQYQYIVLDPQADIENMTKLLEMPTNFTKHRIVPQMSPFQSLDFVILVRNN